MAVGDIVLQIRLESIRNFLEHVENETASEIQTALTKYEAGEYQDLDEFDNALYHPISRQDIATRAVYYELNALIEHEVQLSAHLAWLESDKHRGPKALDLNDLFPESVQSLRVIADLPFVEIAKLVKHKYGIELSELEGGEGFFKDAATRKRIQTPAWLG